MKEAETEIKKAVADKHDDARKAELRKLLQDINKKYEIDAVHFGSEEKEWEKIGFGVPPIDEMLGGGIPRGRFSVLWGPPQCLASFTKVPFYTETKNGRKKTKKNKTIERLYHMFNNKPQKGHGKYLRKETIGKKYFLPSVNDKNEIFRNEIEGVIYSGKKEVYIVKAKNGKTIYATLDHEFLTDNGFVQLKNLKVGDEVLCHTKEQKNKEKKKQLRVGGVCVKYHPSEKWKTVGKSKYCRVSNSYLVYEAYMNDMPVSEYRSFLNENNRENIKKLKTVNSKTHEIHHKDENRGNNKLENLQLLTIKEHSNLHKEMSIRNIRFKATKSPIVSITKHGVEDCYDISMKSPANNFVAEGFIVHNCGKTTLVYNMIAEAQKKGLTVCLMALEGFDAERAKLFGVDLELLIVARFPKAEQSLDTLIKLSKDKVVDLIIVDSIHSMAPKGELEEGKAGKEKSTEADTMALLARKLSQFFRMATDPVYRGNVAVLLIGQTRTNVGFIAFEQLSGGNALKHSAKLIMHLRRGQKADAPVERFKDDEGKRQEIIVGFDTCFKLEKVQVPNTAPEGSSANIPFYYEKGFVWE